MCEWDLKAAVLGGPLEMKMLDSKGKMTMSYLEPSTVLRWKVRKD